ncbi:hypothetical protein [Romboutsia weinsteinii]|nr:hypothetical protein [Romboutsia weinsteinii]
MSTRMVRALNSNKEKIGDANQGPKFELSFTPAGLDPQGFQAIDDDDILF